MSSLHQPQTQVGLAIILSGSHVWNLAGGTAELVDAQVSSKGHDGVQPFKRTTVSI
jgi:hypothetical protein